MKTLFTYQKVSIQKLFLLTGLMLWLTTSAFAQTKHTVEVSNIIFSPDVLEITTGDTVEWVNMEGTHNVNGSQTTFPSNPESFGNSTGSGWTYSYVFDTPGGYDYRCDPHYTLGMTGKIEVTDPNGNPDEAFILTVNFLFMGQYEGQVFWMSVYDKNTGKIISRVQTIASAQFSLDVSGIKKNHSYYIDFYADVNENGKYEAPPIDHAWRLTVDDVSGNTTKNVTANTNFTDIMWENRLTVNFSGMDPHVGQELWLAVVDQNSGMEVKRVKATVESDFSVQVYGLEAGMDYNVDFYADFNQNGSYDTPPEDHAWRLELNNATGEDTLNFSHNTNFTDIMWKHSLTVQFSDMTPHIGQMLKIYIVNTTDGMLKDSITVNQVSEADFDIKSNSLLKGHSYNIDFFADLNLNGSYDIPPLDHAWRITLDNVEGDTTLYFSHNLDFTDIFNLTSISDSELKQARMYPNPATDKVMIETGSVNTSNFSLKVYDITGKIILVQKTVMNNKVELDVQKLIQGIYFVELQTPNDKRVMKLTKE